MTALVWDGTGQRRYQTGVDRGVLYRVNNSGVYDSGYAWNGLTTVTESPDGAQATQLYADNLLYLNLLSIEKFKGKIEAYTYPDAFAACDGSAEPESGVTVGQQPRKLFGLSYRTRLGNELEQTELGYLLHLVWGALASPSEKAYASINDSPAAITFSWDFNTTPVDVPGYKPSASMTIDSTKVDASALADLETALYGSVGVDPRLPTPAEVIAFFSGTVTEVTATPPSYNSTTDVVTIPSITGVQYYDETGDLANGSTHTITSSHVYRARPTAGYKFSPLSVDRWEIVFS